MIKRNYKNIIRRLKNYESQPGYENLIIREFQIGDYLFIKLEHSGEKEANKNILIAAGIHGDEPSGVETILSFFKNKLYQSWLDEWNFIFLPCLNPYGYERNKREGKNGKDLNRLFNSTSPPPEVKKTQEILNERKWDLTIELHEDCDSDGYYLFLKARKVSFLDLGRKILSQVRIKMPINSKKEIEGLSSDAGMIHKIPDIESMEWWPMSGYSFTHGSECVMTLETPTSYTMEQRVEAHQNAVICALENYSEFL